MQRRARIIHRGAISIINRHTVRKLRRPEVISNARGFVIFHLPLSRARALNQPTWLTMAFYLILIVSRVEETEERRVRYLGERKVFCRPGRRPKKVLNNY